MYHVLRPEEPEHHESHMCSLQLTVNMDVLTFVHFPQFEKMGNCTQSLTGGPRHIRLLELLNKLVLRCTNFE